MTIATDNDKAGQGFLYRFSKKYMQKYNAELQYITFDVKGVKDVNDYLIYSFKNQYIYNITQVML